MKLNFSNTFSIFCWSLRVSVAIGVLLLCSWQDGIAQSAPQAFPSDYYHWFERMSIKHPNILGKMHGAIKPIQRHDLFEAARLIDSTEGDRATSLSKAWLQKIFEENNDWLTSAPIEDKSTSTKSRDTIGIFHTGVVIQGAPNEQHELPNSKRPMLGRFYKSPAHLYELDKPNFQLKINPLLRFALAREQGDDHLLFWNHRGISIRGRIDERIYFHTSILESQARYPSYIRSFTEQFNAVPRAGFYKKYESALFDFDGGVDFLLARGFVGTNISKHINIEFGHGRHFIGNGIRSLLLSDFSTDHFYLKFNTRIWKLHYQNIFGELIEARRRNSPDQLLPKKYFAAHYLSFKLRPNLSIGLFETVVFARENQFELQYLNPIILYRTVEGSIGSPDNVLLGLNASWSLAGQIELYSQFVLDEFKVSEIGKGSGWWGNKYGIQIGSRYIDVFDVDHLDLQVEYNAVRPYTYSHNDITSTYSHYNQGLAHPLGANFRELLVRLRYQPHPRIVADLHAMLVKTGRDRDTLNYGSNVLLNNSTRVQDFGNEIGQGIPTDISLLGVNLSYELKRNFYFDLTLQYRKEDRIDQLLTRHTYVGGGVRWNMGKIFHEF